MVLGMGLDVRRSHHAVGVGVVMVIRDGVMSLLRHSAEALTEEEAELGVTNNESSARPVTDPLSDLFSSPSC